MNKEGKHLYWKQRMKWWDASKAEPNEWQEVEDNELDNPLLPEGEYAVSFLTHRTQVDFGSVKITPVESLTLQE
ncbi:MAG: hypothetical protein F6K24_11410 [Okeania sp. SIO2D1]|nr:hypothetical protein [Okeania sp. SIO2D1]